MNKIMRLFVCVALIASTLLLSSCGPIPDRGDPGLFPEGYTGGVGISDEFDEELYCLETYEETIAAIEKLKSHGTKISEDSLIFSYDGGLFDTKYFIAMGAGSDKIKKGDDPYDRFGGIVYVFCVALFDEISVDELVYDYYYNYRGFVISKTNVLIPYSKEIFTLPPVLSEWNSKGGYVTYGGIYALSVSYTPPSAELGEYSTSQEAIYAALNSLVFL